MRTLAVVVELGRRSVRQTFRRPQLIAPLLIIPTLLLAVQSAGAGRAVDLPGFPPVESFFDFLLAGAMIQSALLAGNSGGIAMAIDIEMGFTDRLLAAPIPRFAIVAGRLAGTAAMGVVTAIWFLVLGLVFGVRIEEGPAGALLMIVLVARSGAGPAQRQRLGRAGHVPARLRDPVPFDGVLSGRSAARAGPDDRPL